MNDKILLSVDGEVDQSLALTFSDFSQFEDTDQLLDVSRIDPKRKGDAIKLDSLLRKAGVRESAKYIGLHASSDDFHASIPLEPVQNRGIIIFRYDGQPLSQAAGGPVRFFIPDFAACHTDEIDECANVKFVDRIELTAERGIDNRPTDDEEHQRLHEK